MKAGYEARIRAKRDKERDREEREAEERREIEERESNLGEWAGKLRKEQEVRVSLFILLKRVLMCCLFFSWLRH